MTNINLTPKRKSWTIMNLSKDPVTTFTKDHNGAFTVHVIPPGKTATIKDHTILPNNITLGTGPAISLEFLTDATQWKMRRY